MLPISCQISLLSPPEMILQYLFTEEWLRPANLLFSISEYQHGKYFTDGNIYQVDFLQSDLSTSQGSCQCKDLL